MQEVLQQVFEQVKTKAVYVAFVAGLSCSYLANVPFLKTQLLNSQTALSKSLDNNTSLNNTLNKEIQKVTDLNIKVNNLKLRKQKLENELDNYAEQCTLQCNEKLSECAKKIEKTKLDCIKRRRKK